MAELDEQFLQSIMLRDPGAAAKGGFAPLMQDYMRLQNEAARRAAAAPDTKEAVKAGYERAIQGQQQQMAGMALASATPEYRGIADTTYRQGLEVQGPSQMAEGVFTPGQGYTADPVKRNDRLTRAVAAQAAAAQHAAGAYGQQEDREAGRLHQAATLEEQKRHARVVEGHAASQAAAAHAAGKIQKVTDSQGNESFVRIQGNQMFPLTMAGGAPGPSGPVADTLPKHATNEDKQIYSRGSLALQGGAATLTQLQDPKLRGEFNATRGTGAMIEAATGIPIGAGTPEQKQMRAVIMARAYKTITDLAGATLSPQEAAKIMQFAPGPRDSAEAIESKIKAAMDMARLDRSTLRRNYGLPEDREQYGGAQAPQPGQRRAGDAVPALNQRKAGYLAD